MRKNFGRWTGYLTGSTGFFEVTDLYGSAGYCTLP